MAALAGQPESTGEGFVGVLGPRAGEGKRAAAALAVALPVVAARRRLWRTVRRLGRPAQPVAIKASFACTTQRDHRPDHIPKKSKPLTNYIVSPDDSATSAA